MQQHVAGLRSPSDNLLFIAMETVREKVFTSNLQSVADRVELLALCEVSLDGPPAGDEQSERLN